MLDTFLFDLDGTLLPLDIEEFERIYFKELSHEFRDTVHSDAIIKYIMESLEVMLANNGKKLNCEVFGENFSKLIENPFNIYKDKFDSFYKNGYIKTKTVTQKEPLIKECIQNLKAKGYSLVIATNPLFPKEAILRRIEWSGLEPCDFIHITTYENSSFCKPNIGYYGEILKFIKKTPEQCIMVGNDVQEDGIARELGIKTYIITDNIINRKKETIVCDYIGNYSDFYNYVSSVESIL